MFSLVVVASAGFEASVEFFAASALSFSAWALRAFFVLSTKSPAAFFTPSYILLALSCIVFLDYLAI